MRNSGIIPFIAFLLVFTIACGSDSPTNTTNPQSANEIKKAAQELFADWVEATEKHDASAMYPTLARNITDRCTIEQMEEFFAMDLNAFTYPEMDVKEVFLAAGNTEEAFMTMELRNEPREGEEGTIDSYVANVPYPIAWEDGRWRMVLNFPVLGDGCPFVGSFSSQEATPAETPTPSRK